MDRETRRIVIAGGGTGGHVQPAIAVADTLKQTTEVDLTWIGSPAGIERQVAESRGIRFIPISAGKLRRYFSLYTFTDAVRIPIGILQARLALRSLAPDVVFSTGGFVSVPTVIAAWLAGIPILTHEQTATVGLANRINARFAARIALAYEATTAALSKYADHIVITGNPVRRELVNGDPQRARAKFGFSDELPFIYITGGSLGAQAINECVRTIISDLLEDAAVIHQCGPASINGDYQRLLQAREQLPDSFKERYVVRERIDDELADIYAAADLVVGRAGAGTVAELALLGKPSLLIPLPGSAGDEQTRNAEMLANAGASVLIPQSELTPDCLTRSVTEILGDPERRARMAEAARTVAQPDAARLLANELLSLIGGS